MEIERRWILQPATKEGKEVEEAAAALLDLAGVERIQLFAPRSMLDLRCLGVECRRRGTELVIQWDGDSNFQGLLEIDAGAMEAFRSSAAEARYSSEPVSEAIRMTKYNGVAGLFLRYISNQELAEMLVKAGKKKKDSRPLGVPMSWSGGVAGLHLPGGSHR